MNKIRLVFKGISEIVGSEQLGLLVLTDVAGTRQLTIVCDRHMEYQFSLRVHQAPICHRLLPEVLWNVMSMQSSIELEVVIDQIRDGQYRALLVNTCTQTTETLRASDAILFSYISGIPLYIEERLMMRQSVPYVENAPGMAIPVNAISKDMLQEALDKAVEDENYELAVHLRDEIERRNTSGREDGNERD
jgi:bifunctional DNase/RNase